MVRCLPLSANPNFVMTVFFKQLTIFGYQKSEQSRFGHSLTNFLGAKSPHADSLLGLCPRTSLGDPSPDPLLPHIRKGKYATATKLSRIVHANDRRALLSNSLVCPNVI